MILLQNIYHSFCAHDTPTFHNLTLRIQPGEFCSVIGPNGAGKSTLFKLINGQIQPNSGTISKTGNVASVTQNINSGTVGELSVLENLILCTHNHPRPLLYYRLKSRMMNLISEIGLGLEKFIDKPMRNLSGGQRQIIATICAINSGSPIVLLDEHTSALDPQTQARLMAYTDEKIHTLNLTALMITHDLKDALAYGNRLIMLGAGRIALDTSRSEKQRLEVSDLLTHFNPTLYKETTEAYYDH